MFVSNGIQDEIRTLIYLCITVKSLNVYSYVNKIIPKLQKDLFDSVLLKLCLNSADPENTHTISLPTSSSSKPKIFITTLKFQERRWEGVWIFSAT